MILVILRPGVNVLLLENDHSSSGSFWMFQSLLWNVVIDHFTVVSKQVKQSSDGPGTDYSNSYLTGDGYNQRGDCKVTRWMSKRGVFLIILQQSHIQCAIQMHFGL